MLISYGAPSILANAATATPSNFDVDVLLGLKSSPYSGLQQVGGQNLYYDEGGGFYESYSPTPRQYGRTIYGQFIPVTGPFGMPYTPYYHPIFGYGGGISARGGDEAGTIRRDGQAFKPYTGDIPTGFVETDDGVYEPSMAYLRSISQPTVQAQPNTMFSNVANYTPASMTSLPTQTYGQYGAGQYLGGNSLGFNFSAPSSSQAGGK